MDPDKSGTVEFSEFNDLLGPVLEKTLASKKKNRGLWKNALGAGRLAVPKKGGGAEA
jgi:hypothetical protein